MPGLPEAFLATEPFSKITSYEPEKPVKAPRVRTKIKPGDVRQMMSQRKEPERLKEPSESLSSKSADSCSGTVPGPSDIEELARALKHDVDLIYEWVYSNVDFFPLMGSHKGVLGTPLMKPCV